MDPDVVLVVCRTGESPPAALLITDIGSLPSVRTDMYFPNVGGGERPLAPLKGALKGALTWNVPEEIAKHYIFLPDKHTHLYKSPNCQIGLISWITLFCLSFLYALKCMTKRKLLWSKPIFKCFSAGNKTLEHIQGLPTCVCADMFLEIPRSFEAFVAALLWAFVGLLPGVNSSVRFQSIPCSKRFATPLIITFKRTDSCMWPLMNLR